MNSKTKRVALITGASSGIGKDFALKLLAKGYVVYGGARRVERMGAIESAGGSILAMDVTDDLTMTAAIERSEDSEFQAVWKLMYWRLFQVSAFDGSTHKKSPKRAWGFKLMRIKNRVVIMIATCN